jgi:4-amino-4-deoxy-L-arabinose transferase-like glycosyltransferase
MQMKCELASAISGALCAMVGGELPRIAAARILFGTIFFLNVIATVIAIRHRFQSGLQKGIQVFLVWFFPIIGLITVFAAMGSTQRPEVSE